MYTDFNDICFLRSLKEHKLKTQTKTNYGMGLDL